ncbi:hypothetical protein DFH08DRAFT_1084644 [Mycena albidolilacea]|uniref:Uncharacterized protein n=1 Tax=Mycena albidolilacea TaxID=1033008 RepID=A0AAD7EJT5_9AGAR|nr:hypothetical protein DFH08DRAFT_1084644 [Mycena albidolilacea]
MLSFSTSSFLASTAIFLALSSVSLARPAPRASLLEQGRILQAPLDVDFVPGCTSCNDLQTSVNTLTAVATLCAPSVLSQVEHCFSCLIEGGIAGGPLQEAADSFVDSCNSDPTGAFILGGATLNSGSDSGSDGDDGTGSGPGPSTSGSGQTSATPATTGGASTGNTPPGGPSTSSSSAAKPTGSAGSSSTNTTGGSGTDAPGGGASNDKDKPNGGEHVVATAGAVALGFVGLASALLI